MTDVAVALSPFNAVMAVIALIAVGLIAYLTVATARLKRLRLEEEGAEISAAARAEAERLLRLAGDLSRESSQDPSHSPVDDEP